jgi:hypothetical protein
VSRAAEALLSKRYTNERRRKIGSSAAFFVPSSVF